MLGAQSVLRTVAEWAETERRDLDFVDEDDISFTAPPGATLTAGDFRFLDDKDHVEQNPPRKHLIEAKDVSFAPPTMPAPNEAGGEAVVRISLRPDHPVAGGEYAGPVLADGKPVTEARVHVTGDPNL
jgi:hypothetical protein